MTVVEACSKKTGELQQFVYEMCKLIGVGIRNHFCAFSLRDGNGFDMYSVFMAFSFTMFTINGSWKSGV